MAPGRGTSAVRLVTTRNGNGRVVRVPLTTSESSIEPRGSGSGPAGRRRPDTQSKADNGVLNLDDHQRRHAREESGNKIMTTRNDPLLNVGHDRHQVATARVVNAARPTRPR